MLSVINNSGTGYDLMSPSHMCFHIEQTEKETLKDKTQQETDSEAMSFFLTSYSNMTSWVYSLEIKPLQGIALCIASMALSKTIRKLWVSFP